MENLEYLTEIGQGGLLALPDFIKERLAPFTAHKIKVHLELVEDEENNEYSFRKVRKLLRPIKGNLSADILADRGERL